MKLKTKLLPICGTLAATAAIVTPLATSCKVWNNYRDMLCEYKPGVTPYEKITLNTVTDVDELYWEQFTKNTDILRDDMLWTLSTIVRYENAQPSRYFKQMFKSLDKFNFDIHIDEIIHDDEDTPTKDESAVNFTAEFEFKGEFNEKQEYRTPEGETIYVDYVDYKTTFKTKEAWQLVFEGDNALMSDLSDYYAIVLRRPGTGSDGGLVRISSDREYRYTTDDQAACDMWLSLSDTAEVRDLDKYASKSTSFYYGFGIYFVSQLYRHIYGTGSSTYEWWFASHYLENVIIDEE